jgi:hypothetical protein
MQRLTRVVWNALRRASVGGSQAAEPAAARAPAAAAHASAAVRSTRDWQYAATLNAIEVYLELDAYLSEVEATWSSSVEATDPPVGGLPNRPDHISSDDASQDETFGDLPRRDRCLLLMQRRSGRGNRPRRAVTAATSVAATACTALRTTSAAYC